MFDKLTFKRAFFKHCPTYSIWSEPVRTVHIKILEQKAIIGEVNKDFFKPMILHLKFLVGKRKHILIAKRESLLTILKPSYVFRQKNTSM